MSPSNVIWTLPYDYFTASYGCSILCSTILSLNPIWGWEIMLFFGTTELFINFLGYRWLFERFLLVFVKIVGRFAVIFSPQIEQNYFRNDIWFQRKVYIRKNINECFRKNGQEFDGFECNKMIRRNSQWRVFFSYYSILLAEVYWLCMYGIHIFDPKQS